MNIFISKDAGKVLDDTDAQTRQRVVQAIQKIPTGDIRPLQGYSGYYRLRVGKWRILYRYATDNGVFLTKIATRGDAYKGGF